ncbi:MAG: DUF4115 domain-containing protein, partial [Halieaceae bacterium]
TIAAADAGIEFDSELPEPESPEAGQDAASALSPDEDAGSSLLADNDTADVAGADGLTAALEFSFSGDCWLEVRDADGQLIYADLRAAGDVLQLDGKPPFQVLAGDAAAVEVLYQGEPFAVRTRPGRDTARFTVGDL